LFKQNRKQNKQLAKVCGETKITEKFTMTIEPNAVLDALCAEGKRITIGIEIKDKEKATELLGTMYDESGVASKQGVAVYSWGNFDLVKAHESKEELLRAEVQRHRAHMDAIMELHLQTYCELERNDFNELVFDVNDHIKPKY
jgi:hypothetical protein